jgi:hypothetical protein
VGTVATERLIASLTKRVCRDDIACYATASTRALQAKLGELVDCILRPNGIEPGGFEANSVNKSSTFFVIAAMTSVAVMPLARPAQADTASTVAIVAAAGAIVGALLTDSNNQSYYVNNGRHVYVSRNTATYYRAHGNNRGHGQQYNERQRNDQHNDNRR